MTFAVQSGGAWLNIPANTSANSDDTSGEATLDLNNGGSLATSTSTTPGVLKIPAKGTSETVVVKVSAKYAPSIRVSVEIKTNE